MTAAPVESSPASKDTLDRQALGSESISNPSLHAVPHLLCKIGGSETHSGLCRVLWTSLDEREVVPGVGLRAGIPPRCHPPTNTLLNHRVYFRFHYYEYHIAT